MSVKDRPQRFRDVVVVAALLMTIYSIRIILIGGETRDIILAIAMLLVLVVVIAILMLRSNRQ